MDVPFTSSSNFWALDEFWVNNFTSSSQAPASQIDIDSNGIATLDIIGPISFYENLYSFWSGEPTVEGLLKDLDFIESESAIKGIILRIDSPGGVASGITELTDRIHNFPKPIIGWGNTVASAALLVGTATKALYVSSMSIVGSVGVIYVQSHYESERLKITKIVSKNAPLKAADADTQEGRDAILNCINALEDTFIQRLATYKSKTKQDIQKNWGRGAVLPAQEAQEVGMIDGITSFIEAKEKLRELIMSDPTPSTTLAAVEPPQIGMAQIREMLEQQKTELAAQLKAQETKFSEQLSAQEAAFKVTQQQESERKTGIKSIFEIFTGDPYETNYLFLEAQCLADESVTPEVARQKIIQLRGSFTQNKPISGVNPNINASTPLTKETKDASVLLAEFRADGLTEGEAIKKLASEHPDEHILYVEKLNPGVNPQWKMEGTF